MDLNFNNVEPETVRVPVSFEDALAKFRSEAGAMGLKVGEVLVNDEVQRVPIKDQKPGKLTGWYALHEVDGMVVGAFGDWREAGSWTRFVSKDVQYISMSTQKLINERLEASRLEMEKRREEASTVAQERLESATDARADHPYLVAKGVKAYGLGEIDGRLQVPICDLEGKVLSTQSIDATGFKLFQKGGNPVGVHIIGSDTDSVVVCEGYATGASIHEASGLQVYVCFSASSLVKLAPQIAEKIGRRGASLIIGADNDEAGLKAVSEALKACPGAVSVTPKGEGQDWNDVFAVDQVAVRDAFASEALPMAKFESWKVIDESAVEPRRWLYGNHYVRSFCSLTVAEPGIGKSLLALTEAVSMATGKAILGVTCEPIRVCYHNSEDPKAEIVRRVLSICKKFNINQEELVGRLFISSGRENDLVLSAGDNGDIVEGAFAMCERFVKRWGVDLIVLDPLANMMSSPETNEVFRALGKRLSFLADKMAIGIEIVHHTRKLNHSDGSRTASVESARGGSSLIGAVRTARALSGCSRAEAERLGLDNWIDYFKVEAGAKANLSRSSEKSDWFKKSGIQLLNGDWVGVCEVFQLPDVFDGISVSDAGRVRSAIGAMDEAPMFNNRARRWVGNVVADVLDIDVTDKAGRRRVSRLIDGWIKTNVLAVELWKDKRQGKESEVVVMGENNPRLEAPP